MYNPKEGGKNVSDAEKKEKTTCFPFTHQWTRWQEHAKGELKDQYRGEKFVGYYETQRRECVVCKKSQLRIEQVARAQVS